VFGTSAVLAVNDPANVDLVSHVLQVLSVAARKSSVTLGWVLRRWLSQAGVYAVLSPALWQFVANTLVPA
jgi:hypothetical protein